MRIRGIERPGPEKRIIPPGELKIIEPLIEKMGTVWAHRAPPTSGLSRMAVYGHSFMSLRRLDPFFIEKIGGSRLVDLGAGEPDCMTHFAMACGASDYVAVDRYVNYAKKVPPFINVRYVNQDMLMFMAEQPDKSANVVMLAIDHIILGNYEDRMTERLYKGMLLAEIKRVVPTGGIAFGMNCELLLGLDDMGFERVSELSGKRLPDEYLEGGIFMKIQ